VAILTCRHQLQYFSCIKLCVNNKTEMKYELRDAQQKGKSKFCENESLCRAFILGESLRGHWGHSHEKLGQAKKLPLFVKVQPLFCLSFGLIAAPVLLIFERRINQEMNSSHTIITMVEGFTCFPY